MIRRLLHIAIILISVGSSLYALPQDPGEIFDQGVSLYSEGDYPGAVAEWEKLVYSGYTSYDLFYNLGNANFKNGNIPGAILYYEKALLARPFNEDVKYNLEIARTYITDSFETVPELFLLKWYRMVSLIFHSNTWAVISLLLFISALGLILLYLLSARIRIKKTSFIAAVLFVLLSVISISLSYQNNILKTRKQNAIIFAPAVTGKSSPDESGKDLFLIHEGTKVKIEDSLGDWYEVRLSDGNVGWIPGESLRKV